MADDKEELERVRRQLDEITAERDGLLAENYRLRREFGKPQKSKPANLSDLVSAASNPLSTGSRGSQQRVPFVREGQAFPLPVSWTGRRVCQAVVEPEEPEDRLQPGLQSRMEPFQSRPA